MNERLRLLVLPVLAVLLALAAAPPARAQGSAASVGLGVMAGLAFPNGSTADIPSTDWQASFNWGFFVNIPILSTLHLTPSAELYHLAGANATDFSLAFKFIVPLSRVDLYAGLVPGLTATAEVTAPNVGVLAGASFPLVSNLDWYAQAKFDWVFQGDRNLRVLHANAGILFLF
jgi:hypothetical protein